MDSTKQQFSPPPLVKGLPVLGSVAELSKDLIGLIVKQYQQLGPIFRIRALNQELIVLAGPEANIFVTTEGADKFSSRETWTNFGLEFGTESNIQNLDGLKHIELRKIMKRGYSASNLMSNIPQLVDIARNVLQRFEVGEEVVALQLIRLIVTEQLGVALTGHAPGADLESIIAFIRTALNVHVTKTTPALMLKMPAYQKARKRTLELGQEIIEEHRNTTREKPDLIDDLLAASQKSELEDVLGSKYQLGNAALGPFVAGLDTVSNECNFMLYALLNHPDVLKQCVEEADQFFAEGTPRLEQIKSLGVLHHAMMETLRLYSIAPVVTRNAAKDFDFAGYHVEKGQPIIIASTASHFLPTLFADPYTFDITRYSEPRKEHKQRGAYSPFGIGTHLCLGAGAAEAQIVLVMTSLLHMVKLEQVPAKKKIKIKNDPTPTLGDTFHIRIVEQR